MKKPKVAFIHPSIGDSFGGSQIFVLELAERLKDKCDITILSAKKVNSLCKPIFSISREQANKFSLAKKLLNKFVSTPNIVIEHLSSFFPVLFHLLVNKYDVIFPNNDWGGLLVASTVRKLKGTPVLFTEHNGFLEKGKIARRNLEFNPDRYIVLSQDFEFWMKKYYPESAVEYIPNGVNFDKFNPNIKPKIIDLPRPIFLTAARYEESKRLELAIEAVAKLNQGSLLILSKGKNIEALNEKGKKLLGEDRFKIISAQHSEMASYYRACDVFTLPSLYEPFGLVYLEAMACNKPVVSPNDLSRTDIIGKAGILCDVADIGSYAHSLKLAAQSNFGDIPYNQAKKYTWESAADKYFEVIKLLI